MLVANTDFLVYAFESKFDPFLLNLISLKFAFNLIENVIFLGKQ